MKGMEGVLGAGNLPGFESYFLRYHSALWLWGVRLLGDRLIKFVGYFAFAEFIRRYCMAF
jgi:hypothetical protein